MGVCFHAWAWPLSSPLQQAAHVRPMQAVLQLGQGRQRAKAVRGVVVREKRLVEARKAWLRLGWVVRMCSPLSIRVGDRFSSFGQLEEAIRRLEEAQGVTFSRRDSRTIAAAAKRLKDGAVNINPELKYQKVMWSCTKGGRASKPRLRTPHSFSGNCLACVTVSASADGQSLVVVIANLTHNHLPVQMPGNHSKRLNNLSKVKQKPDVLKRPVCPENCGNHKEYSSLDQILAELKQNTDCIVEVLLDAEHLLKGVYFQDRKMQNHFGQFPEVLLVDATCRLENYQLYVHLAVDGNSDCHLVAIFVVSDDSEAVSAMVDVFKYHNPAWGKTQLVVTDEASVERVVYALHFPNAQQLLSPHHVAETMSRDVQQMENLTKRDKQRGLVLLERIACSCGQLNYQKNLRRLCKKGVQPIIDYYTQTWHPVCEQWVVAYKECYLYSQDTTQQVAHFLRVLRRSVLIQCTLRSFLQNLSSVLVLGLRVALSEAALQQARMDTQPGSPERRYAQELTPYATRLVSTQLQLSRDVQIPDGVGPCDTVHVSSSSSGNLAVTATSCTCPFAKANVLPCRHMLAFRAKCGLDLFLKGGAAPRWHLEYCSGKNMGEEEKEEEDLVSEEDDDDDEEQEEEEDDDDGSVESLTRTLRLLIQGAPVAVQQQRVAVLQQLLRLWKQNKQVELVEVKTITWQSGAAGEKC